MLCKFKNATCLPACLAGSFTHQESKWFKTQMLSNLRCRSTLQWSNYCLGGSYYPHYAMNSTKSKHAFIIIYFLNYCIVKRSFEKSSSSLNVNLTIFSPCLEKQRSPAVSLSYGIGFLTPHPPKKNRQAVEALVLYATDQRVQTPGCLQGWTPVLFTLTSTAYSW